MIPTICTAIRSCRVLHFVWPRSRATNESKRTSQQNRRTPPQVFFRQKKTCGGVFRFSKGILRFSFGRRIPVEAFSGFQKAFSVFLLAEDNLWRHSPVFKRHSPFFFWQKTTCGGILRFSKGILRFSFAKRQMENASSSLPSKE